MTNADIASVVDAADSDQRLFWVCSPTMGERIVVGLTTMAAFIAPLIALGLVSSGQIALGVLVGALAAGAWVVVARAAYAALRGGRYFLEATREGLRWGWSHLPRGQRFIAAGDLQAIFWRAEPDPESPNDLALTTRQGVVHRLYLFSGRTYGDDIHRRLLAFFPHIQDLPKRP